MVIKKALAQTKGVKTVDLNVEKRTATIVYDDAHVTEAQIEKAIEKSGFKTESGFAHSFSTFSRFNERQSRMWEY